MGTRPGGVRKSVLRWFRVKSEKGFGSQGTNHAFVVCMSKISGVFSGEAVPITMSLLPGAEGTLLQNTFVVSAGKVSLVSALQADTIYTI
jgi:hypothetical protein